VRFNSKANPFSFASLLSSAIFFEIKVSFFSYSKASSSFFVFFFLKIFKNENIKNILQ